MARSYGAKYKAWVFLVCSSLAGVQFVYSMQAAAGTPLFHAHLKVSASAVTLILATAGPISGFLVQPIAGAVSDACASRWGRRRPFIFVSSLLCAIGMMLIAFSGDIGTVLGDLPDGPAPHNHVWGLISAITGIWLMNIFNNFLHAPSRALIADILPNEEQQFGNAAVSAMMGFSAILANVIGAQTFLTAQPYRLIFSIGAVAVVVTTIPTLVFGKEQHYERLAASKFRFLQIFSQMLHTLLHLPKHMIVIVVVYFLSWCAFAPFTLYFTTFVGENIFHGYSIGLYERGVKIGMYGLAILSGSQWGFSLVQTFFVSKSSPGFIYSITQACATAAFFFIAFMPALLTEKTVQVVIVFVMAVLLGINYAVMNSIPFAAIKGIAVMGFLNSVCVVAQTFVSLLAGLAIHCYHQNVGAAILVGAGFSMCATVAACFIQASIPPRILDVSGV